MESYFKRIFIGHLLVLIIVACTIFYLGKSHAIAILLFVGLIELEDKIDGIQTFNFYQSGGSELKLARKYLEEMIQP